MAVCQNLVPLVNPKIAGKWMFIPTKNVSIGIDPYPYVIKKDISPGHATLYNQYLSTRSSTLTETYQGIFRWAMKLRVLSGLNISKHIKESWVYDPPSDHI